MIFETDGCAVDGLIAATDCRVGSRTLRILDFGKVAATFTDTCGAGYPRGLKGTEIPLAARLFAVVDVWDALTSDRPYRPAWSAEETLAYIREQSGKHFDPEIVELFLRTMDKSRAPAAYSLK